MPTYAYKCKSCGNALEVQQGFSDPSLTECPVCGGVLRKQYGSVGVTFNGSGFYRTDSRATGKDGGGKPDHGSDAGRSDGGKTDGGKTEGGKSDAGKPESKPAAAKSDAPATKSTAAASASS
jgi:putative FmdB family regulatory protein